MLKFTKMQGLGNDYVYMDAISQKIDNRPDLARFVSDRHFGVGSDGLILICKSEKADFKMEMYNSDGTQAEMCGNGIRCVGKFVYDKGLTDKTTINIETLAGIKTLKLHVKNGKVETVRVDMGKPILEPKEIPINIENIEDGPGLRNIKNIPIKAIDKDFLFTFVSMGNPHAITVVDDTENFDVQKYGKIIEVDSMFPNRTNVEFVSIINKDYIKMRVWERGAGETLACGTGACATAVACYLNGLTNRNVNIELLGGNLEIEWNEENDHIYMTGPAVTVFEGGINYEKL